MLPATAQEATAALKALEPFIGRSQRKVLADNCRGEERQFFFDLLRDLAVRISTMPTTYAQASAGKNAIVFLHYFRGNQDWYVTEKDSEPIQEQAFGLVDLGFGGELGYFSIVDLVKTDIEIDLYWTPKTLSEIIDSHDQRRSPNP